MLKQALRLLLCGFVPLLLLLTVGCSGKSTSNYPDYCYEDSSFYDNRALIAYSKAKSEDFQYIRSNFFTFKFLKPWVQVPKVTILGDDKTNAPTVVETYAIQNTDNGALFRISVIDIGKPFYYSDYSKYSLKLAEKLTQKGVELRRFHYYDPDYYGFYGRLGDKILFTRLHGFAHYIVHIEGFYTGPHDDLAILTDHIEFPQ